MSDPVDTRPHGRGAAEAPEPRDGRGELPTPPSGVNLRSVAYHGKSAIAVLISLAVLVGGGWFAMTKLQSGIEGCVDGGHLALARRQAIGGQLGRIRTNSRSMAMWCVATTWRPR